MREPSLPYATFWQRLLAHNIDLILLLGLFYVYSLIPNTSYDSIAFFGIYVLYHCIFELSSWQASPGKKWIRLKVKKEHKEQNIILGSLIRNSSKLFSLVIFFVGFAMINLNKKKQGLHDYIAGTVVLFEEELA